MIAVCCAGLVVLPTFGASSSTVVVNEGGKPVFANGKFVSGVSGVHAAQVEKDATGQNVRLTVGSGTYAFEIFV